ncbi:hypothetical protein FRB90_001277 [Tulasnella sp. 427]|nr:hypothetical protein FRB90_001277 [Tulasnella sp. 427]
MINALFQEGALNDAMAYFKKAEELFVGEGKKVDDAESLVKAMRTNPTAPRPDTITYNTLLRHYARKHDPSNFVRVLQELVSSGLNPDSYTFTTIVDSNPTAPTPYPECSTDGSRQDPRQHRNIHGDHRLPDPVEGRAERPRGVAAPQQDGRRRGVHANEVTFTSLLAGLSRADHSHPEVQSRLVYENMGKMTARGMDPNRVTGNFLLLDALKTDGILGTDKAMKLWRETIAEKVIFGMYLPQNLVGWGLTAIGVGLLLLLKVETAKPQWIGFQIVTGVGMGIIWSAPQFPILASLPVTKSAQALALYSFVRSYSQTWGVTIGATILQNELKKKLPEAYLAQFPWEGAEIAYAVIPQIPGLPEPVKTEVRDAFAASFRPIWLTMVALSVLGLLCVVGMQELVMHKRTDDEWGMEGQEQEKPAERDSARS